MKTSNKYRILYKTLCGKNIYVSDYECFKLNNKTVLGAFKYTSNIDEAKRIPAHISKDNLLDTNLNSASITILSRNFNF